MSTSLEVNVYVECSECGKELSWGSTTSRHGAITISVDPCTKCLDAANSDGFREGKNDGK